MREILKILRGYGELTPDIGFDVVTRHSLADETDLLEKLGLTGEDCDSCDALWSFEDKIVFISFFSTVNTDRGNYTLYKFDDQARNGGGHHFNVATTQFPLEKKHIANALRYLSKWLASEQNDIRKLKPPNFVQITNTDICEA